MRDWKSVVRERMAPLGMEGTAEAEWIEELTQHLEDKYRELMRGGASEEEAYRTAAAEMDDVAPMRAGLERSERMPRDEATGSFMADLGRDLRYAGRGMGKNPGFVLFVVLTLGLGIGANTTVFTIVNTMILNPLPVPDAPGLAAVETVEAKSAAKGGAGLPVSHANLDDYGRKNEVFASLAGFTSPRSMTLEASGGAQRMFGEFVTGNYFATLGLRPAAGRFFLPEEDGAPGGHAVAVMNYATWQARFGGGSDIVGKTLRLNGIVFTVIGVASRQFIGVNAVFGPDLRIPSAVKETMLPEEMKGALNERSKAEFVGVGRLKPGVGTAPVREDPEANEGRMAAVRPVNFAVNIALSINVRPDGIGGVLFAGAAGEPGGSAGGVAGGVRARMRI